MPRSKNDPHKRKCAQFLNHLASAILDLNDVYTAFGETRDKMKALTEQDPERLAGVTLAEGQKLEETIEYQQSLINQGNYERYNTYCEDLKITMLGVNACREKVLMFVNIIWGLDEDSIKVYLG